MEVVASGQSSVIRNCVAASLIPRLLVMIRGKFCFIFFLLITEHWILSTAHARDCGTHGVIYPIEEEDPVVLIQQKLKGMEESGELKRHNIELQKKTKAAVERPKPVEGITRASETRVFTFDPTYVVKENLKDHTGKIFFKKGTKINPLETVNLSQALLFFDGDDLEQKAWARDKLKEGHVRLILVKGAPLTLSEEWNGPVYFDQGGFLTTKLGIKHVPALVTQTGLLLQIEEACPPFKSGAGSWAIDPRIKLGEGPPSEGENQ